MSTLHRWVTRAFALVRSLWTLRKRSGQWRYVAAGYGRGRSLLGYGLYLPASRSGRGTLPLIVMLHGCHQDAKSFATGTGMNRIAEREGFAVLYPEQSSRANALRCWNWFAQDVLRGEGETQALVNLIRRVRGHYGIDAERVYIAGMSAGAAMAQVLIVRHPELFAAAGLHSGLMYRAVATAWQAMGTMHRGSGRSPAEAVRAVRGDSTISIRVPTLLIHGAADKTVAPRNAEQLAEQICALAGVDPNAKGKSAVPRETSMIAGGRRYQVREWSRDGQLLVRLCLVEQLGHAWSGGNPELSFNDAAGPDASRMIWEFVAPFRRSVAASPRA